MFREICTVDLTNYTDKDLYNIEQKCLNSAIKRIKYLKYLDDLISIGYFKKDAIASIKAKIIRKNKIILNNKQGVYLFRDVSNNIVYVGESCNLYRRLNKNHPVLSQYGNELYTVTIFECDNRLLIEAILIYTLNPKYNYADELYNLCVYKEAVDKEINTVGSEIYNIINKII